MINAGDFLTAYFTLYWWRRGVAVKLLAYGLMGLSTKLFYVGPG